MGLLISLNYWQLNDLIEMSKKRKIIGVRFSYSTKKTDGIISELKRELDSSNLQPYQIKNLKKKIESYERIG